MTEIKQFEPLWGVWYVDSQIGEGSYGRVYKLHREEFGKTYYSAVKIISIPRDESEVKQLLSEGMDGKSLSNYFNSVVAELVSEIELMSKFKGHSNIVSLEDHQVIRKADGIGHDILIRMELLKNLSDFAMEKPLTHEDIIKLGIHVCRALELFALEKITHRDIKPGNIYVSPYGDYKLGDFGVARQVERTSQGMTKKTGTDTYMAPEVWRGRDYSSNVDMYSLGIVMYRFLNQNRTPFLPEAPNPITPNDREAAQRRRLQGEPIPPLKGVSAELNAIVQNACDFDPGARFSSPTAMREALEALLGNESAPFVFAPTKQSSPQASQPQATIGGLHASPQAPQPQATTSPPGAWKPMPSSSQTNYSKSDDRTGIMFGPGLGGVPAQQSYHDDKAGILFGPVSDAAAPQGYPQVGDWQSDRTAAHVSPAAYAQHSMRTAKPAKKKIKRIVLACVSLAAIAVVVVLLLTGTNGADNQLLGEVNSDVVGGWAGPGFVFIFNEDGTGWRDWAVAPGDFEWGVESGYINIQIEGRDLEVWRLGIYDDRITLDGTPLYRYRGG